ncbi:hypothetical protein [Synechocystis sp. LKSZ1]|uniref:hypothetical protein n=1 Tax=Synechocystis sp. LKSZ1 TaxID=3144951 RepID=UPI00336BBF10
MAGLRRRWRLAVFLFTGAGLAAWLAWEWHLPVYPGPWQTGPQSELDDTIRAHNLKGCSRYQYRQNAQNSIEYLVYCTTEGQSWQGYLMLPGLQKIVAGPFPPDPTLQ